MLCFANCRCIPADHGGTFESEPARAFNLKHSGVTMPLHIPDFLAVVARDDSGYAVSCVPRETHRDNVRQSACSQCREGTEMPFRQKFSCFGSEIRGGVCHGAHGSRAH